MLHLSNLSIIEIELTKHPNRIGRDPTANGQVMGQIRSIGAAQPSDIQAQEKGGNRHGHPQHLEIRNPSKILQQPKDYVQVFLGPQT